EAGEPSLHFIWSDPDGLHDLLSSSLAVRLGGTWGLDVTTLLVDLYRTFPGIVSIEFPDLNTLRVSLRGLTFPTGTYHWSISVRDWQGAYAEGAHRMVIN
ncbi:MAG: hypothetical protein ACYTG5_17940, partial [Planctomycetota bacterium]